MKSFIFRYDPSSKSLKDMGARMDEAVRTGIPHIQPKNEIRSGSISALLEIATENRIRLFMTIVSERPESIYELAQLVSKDQSYVNKEVKVLEALGLIALEKFEGEGRAKVKPVALYETIELVFGAKRRAKVS